MYMKERKQSPKSITCRCGRELDLIEGQRVFHVGGRKISLNNILHYYSTRCDKSVFDSMLNVDGITICLQ
jgi:hypothetical protein